MCQKAISRIDNGSNVFDRTESLASDLETEHLIDEYAPSSEIWALVLWLDNTRRSLPIRQPCLKSFAEASIDVLTSIKCLDEGVDVPQERAGYILARNTGGQRQFILQRQARAANAQR